MVEQKKGFPEEGEILQCTVTSVQSHSIFVRLDEYGINGMIHISEVAPGRIRNIRDFVMEGKSVICKVLRVNPERGHVDLSLRRVSESQKRNKINELKKEKFAEKLLEVVAENLSIDAKLLHATVSEKVKEHFYLLFECFTEVAKGVFSISELGLEKRIADELKKVILDRLKPEVIVSKGKLTIQSYLPDGVEVVKAALKQAADTGAELKYFGGGVYAISCKAGNYKESEALLNKAAEKAMKYIKSKHGTGEFSEAEA